MADRSGQVKRQRDDRDLASGDRAPKKQRPESLDDLISQVAAGVEPQPDPKPHVAKIFSTLKKAVHDMSGLNRATTTMEVEIRLGLQQGSQFAAEVSEKEFDAARQVLQQQTDDVYGSTSYDWTLPTPGDSRSSSKRGTTNEPEADEYESVMLKTHRDQEVVHLNRAKYAYDFRVAWNQEMTMERCKTAAAPATSVRWKERESFMFSEPLPAAAVGRDEVELDLFHVDLTRVETLGVKQLPHGKQAASDAGKITYEIEFEFVDRSFDRFAADEALLRLAVDKLCKVLFDVLDAVSHRGVESPADAGPFPGLLPLAQLRAPNEQLQGVQRAIHALFRDHYPAHALQDLSRLAFPGAMPVNFMRRHLSQLAAGNYLASEKTDGVRYFLVVQRGAVFFVDRKFSVARLEPPYDQPYLDHLSAPAAPDGVETVLDGELVISKDRLVFFAFDVLAMRGERVAHLTFSMRLRRLYEEVIRPFTEQFAQATAETLVFALMRKAFVPKHNLRDILSKIRKEVKPDGSVQRVFFDPPRRRHATDGLMFAEDKPYQPFTDYHFFKWKQGEKLTVDVRVSEEGGRLKMLCLTPSHTEDEFGDANFAPEELKRFRDDCMRLRKSPDARQLEERPIVEVAYDGTTGRWRYHTLRTDKNVPNFLRTLVDTLLTAVENVTTQQLVEVCGALPPPQAPLPAPDGSLPTQLEVPPSAPPHEQPPPEPPKKPRGPPPPKAKRALTVPVVTEMKEAKETAGDGHPDRMDLDQT